jgi:hypothetical protein
MGRSSDWSKGHDKICERNVMNDGNVGVMYMTGHDVFVEYSG